MANKVAPVDRVAGVDAEAARALPVLSPRLDRRPVSATSRAVEAVSAADAAVASGAAVAADDVRAFAPVSAATIASGPITAMAELGGNLLTANYADDTLSLVARRGPRRAATVTDVYEPFAIAVAGQRAYVTSVEPAYDTVTVLERGEVVARERPAPWSLAEGAHDGDESIELGLAVEIRARRHRRALADGRSAGDDHLLQLFVGDARLPFLVRVVARLRDKSSGAGPVTLARCAVADPTTRREELARVGRLRDRRLLRGSLIGLRLRRLPFGLAASDDDGSEGDGDDEIRQVHVMVLVLHWWSGIEIRPRAWRSSVSGR